jgi:membrane associated rhomboid family serine protease
MREPGDVVTAAFPRPGRALKVVLAIIAAFAIAGAIVVHWMPGGPAGAEIWRTFAFEPTAVLTHPWTLITSGILTYPDGLSHALWSIVGLYFLTTDLERKWGGARLVRFLVASVVVGNLAVLAVSLLPLSSAVFHPPFVVGPLAAITATAIAWSKENKNAQIRFFFFLPMSGRTLFWVTVGLVTLSLVFVSGAPEGAVAPAGGVLAGLLFGGSPSPTRSAWLRLKLAFMRRKGPSLTVESITGPTERPRTAKRASGKSPALRVVYGGLEDELKNRKPPKDKRYLN